MVLHAVSPSWGQTQSLFPELCPHLKADEPTITSSASKASKPQVFLGDKVPGQLGPVTQTPTAAAIDISHVFVLPVPSPCV